MNQLVIIGVLGKDPALKYTQSGHAIASGIVAVKRKFAKEGYQDTDWLNFKSIGKTAENIAKFFSKGSKVAFTGAYQIDQYEKDGERKSFGYMMVNGFDFVDSKKKDDDFGGMDTSDFTSVEDDSDIPF